MGSRQLSTEECLPSFYKHYRKSLNNFLLYFYIYGIARESPADRKGLIAYQRSNSRKSWLEIDLEACFL